VAYNLGVDLGTTFVAAAVSYPTQVEMFTLGDRSVVVPAVVYLRDDGQLVTGEAANRRAVSNPDRVCREFKRRLGDPTPVMLGGTPHAVTDLLGALLRDVLAKVTETEGGPPERVVLTHPANWGPFRRGLFEEVPNLAGLSDVTLVTEPEAAAAHYATSRRLDDGETVAVYDLGGGTFDATVLRKRPGGVEILGTPEGIERLGGVDFDEAILSHVNVAAGGALGELDMRDPQTTIALARLRQDCVLAKEALSADTETVLPVFLPGRHFDVKLTREEFENMVRAPIESTIGALSRTLRSAQVAPEQLSAVLLVGGSSRIPLVARMVSEELGRPTVVDTHPKYAVALGAATLAGSPSGDRSRSTQLASNGQGPRRSVEQAEPTLATPHGAGGRPWYDRPASGAAAGVPRATPSSAASNAAPSRAVPSGPPRPVPTPAPGRQPPRPQPAAQPSPSEPAAQPPRPVPTPAAQPSRSEPAAQPPRSVPTPAAPPRPVPTQAASPSVDAPAQRAAEPPTAAIPTAGTATAPNGTGGRASSAPAQPRAPRPPVGPATGPGGAVPGGGRPGAPTVGGGGTPPRGVPSAGAPAGPYGPGGSVPPGSGTESGATPPVRGAGRTWQLLGLALLALVAAVAVAVGTVYVINWFRGGSAPGSSSGGTTQVANPAAVAPPPAARDVVASVAVPSLGTPIPIGPTPNFAAASPNGRLLYVANGPAKTITVMDTSVNQMIATIPVPAGPPRFLTFAPDGRRVYLSIWDDARTVAVVAVLDTTSNKIVSSIPVRTRPFRAAVTADGRLLYVPNHDSGTVSVIDTASLKLVKEIKVAPNPHWIEFSKDGARAFTANHESNLISVLDLKTDAVLATVPVGTSPHALAVHPTRPLVADVNFDSNNVTMIDTNTNQVTATIPVGKNPQAIAWTADGRFAYVVNNGDNSVSVINAETNQVTATIPTGPGPTNVAVLPDNRHVYVTTLDNGTLTVLNPGG
jgi:YVTN family beta-propeller protein